MRKAIIILIAILLLTGAQPTHAFFGFGGDTENSRSFFAAGVDRISTAVDKFRSAIGLQSVEDREREEREARRQVLLSVLELIFEEIERSQIQLETLALSEEEYIELATGLEENEAWFRAMEEGVREAQSEYYLTIMAHDIKQFRFQRHSILIRKIAELAIAQRQEQLLTLAQTRLDNIDADIAVLSEDEDTGHLEDLYEEAASNVTQASIYLEHGQAILETIRSPYEEEQYRTLIEEAHELLLDSNAALLRAYQLFVLMTEAATLGE